MTGHGLSEAEVAGREELRAVAEAIWRIVAPEGMPWESLAPSFRAEYVGAVEYALEVRDARMVAAAEQRALREAAKAFETETDPSRDGDLNIAEVADWLDLRAALGAQEDAGRGEGKVPHAEAARPSEGRSGAQEGQG